MKSIDSQLSNRPVFKPSIETEKLIVRLKTMNVGDIITYQEMQDTTGIDCQKDRGCITTARKHLLNEDQAVFAAVRCVGLKRLADGEVVEQEGGTAIKVRRAVRGSMRRLSTVDPETLPPLQAQQHRVTSASLGAISLCVTPSSLGKVQQLVISNGAIDSKQALNLFLK